MLLLRAVTEALLHAHEAPPEGWVLLPVTALARVLDDEASLENLSLVECMCAALQTHCMRTARSTSIAGTRCWCCSAGGATSAGLSRRSACCCARPSRCIDAA